MSYTNTHIMVVQNKHMKAIQDILGYRPSPYPPGYTPQHRPSPDKHAFIATRNAGVARQLFKSKRRASKIKRKSPKKVSPRRKSPPRLR